MNKYLITNLLLLMMLTQAYAEKRTIDISGDNTDKSYTTYSSTIRLQQNDVVDVMMARYCYFSSKIIGSGELNLYAGGERSYLGDADKKWNDWSGYTGDIHIRPYKENSPNAGFYGVVLAHGGKAFSPENIDLSKVNRSMENNRVTLHDGATMCTEANTAGSGFRIGELQTEAGSTLQGYIKNSRAAYYMLGCTNTDATLAGRIAPSGYRDDTALGIIKEGTGTYTITGNDNYLSGALRIMEGRVLVMNDRAATESGKLRGALGAKANTKEAVAFVFSKGILGGTGSIGGMVDNYGTIEPGADGIGLLTLKNYAEAKDANLNLHPASVLRIKVGSTTDFDQLAVDGQVKYSAQTEDFSTSDAMPIIELVVADDNNLQVGDEMTVLIAKGKSDGYWHFDIRANQYTWEIVEREFYSDPDHLYFVVRLTSFEKMNNGDNPDNPVQQESTMGAYYDDGIDDKADTHSLRYYANLNGKKIGAAFSTYKSYQSERDAAGKDFNMLVAENEMKMDALQPSKGGFSFGSADQLVTFAKNNNMTVRGHCLVWHSQLPGWVSSDGKKNDKNWTRREALAIMENHITKVMTHFKGKVSEWDVVNECLDDDQGIVRTDPEGYDMRRQSVWQQAIGDDYVDSAFVYAHRADPDALLYLNDYGVELQGKAKSSAFYNLALRLKNAGIPIDGVGLQCHFSVGDVDSVKLDNTIRRFGEAGLKCIITELDMGISGTTAADLEEQARQYRIITDIVLNNDNCPNMVIWGLKDNDSWRSSSNPLLYNSGMGKKPAWYAVRSALRHRTLGHETGILPIRHTNRTDGNIYNLAGQKVSADYKGIVIVDGKKMLNR